MEYKGGKRGDSDGLLNVNLYIECYYEYTNLGI